MADEVALRVDTVTKSFGGLVAVNDLSFDLVEHEVLGLIGPNGSGKTTMMNLISGALKPSSGRILLYGEEISGSPSNAIARMGVARTFQIVRLLPSLTVIENVCAGGVFGHVKRWGGELEVFARAQLKRVGLEGSASAAIAELTYIDQKRVELARALASEPRVLLLDEWLAGLTHLELRIGIALIEELRAEGRAIVVVEHVMDAIRSVSSSPARWRPSPESCCSTNGSPA